MKKLLLLVAAAVLTISSPPAAAQQPNFDLKEWDVEWGGGTRDPAVAPDGKVWFVGQAGNYVAVFDPKTAQFKRYEIEPGTNPHTVIVDSKGIAWYAGNRNNRIGRLKLEGVDPNWAQYEWRWAKAPNARHGMPDAAASVEQVAA